MSKNLIPEELCLPEYDFEWTHEDELRARYARARADAWARSATGTPYGNTEPVLEVKDASRAPEPLDQRVMARLNGRKGSQ